ncbi:MAG: DeoR/GlpR transcriptional regulator [Phycisphaerae bacterium]|nr:DeoR/GlpR transcriptional regulator [Phycisphaerae bacterium]
MRVADHIVEARRERIAEYLRRHAYASLKDVCLAHRISEATARRDLMTLESKNRIVRTYGGALAEYHQRFPTFRDRLQDQRTPKRRMALAAVKLIQPGTTIYFDLGTSVHAIAEALDRRPVPDVKIVTNSLPVANLLTETGGLRVFLLGGEFLPRQSALLGGTARNSLDSYSIDLAFFSAEAADKRGVWNSQEVIVDLQRAVMQRADQSVFCLDAKKFARQAECFLAGWDEVDMLITNASDEAVAALTSVDRTLV